jgi:hypothetical protein
MFCTCVGIHEDNYSVMSYHATPCRKQTKQKIINPQEIGPLSVSIDASCDEFLYYSGGVFDTGCGSPNNNHAVALVGYNTDPANEFGVNYWICKNSWSKNWGVHGYMYISMDLIDPSSGGSCGICNLLKQPLGVNPKNTTSYVNTTYPSPKIDDDDEDNICDHITVFGRKTGGTSGILCDVLKWLASPHSTITWVIAFALTAVLTFVLSALLRKCCKVCCDVLMCRCGKEEELKEERKRKRKHGTRLK